MAKLKQAAAAARIAADRAAQARAQLITEIDRRRELTAELAGELQSAQMQLQQNLAAMNSGTPRAAVGSSARVLIEMRPAGALELVHGAGSDRFVKGGTIGQHAGTDLAGQSRALERSIPRLWREEVGRHQE